MRILQLGLIAGMLVCVGNAASAKLLEPSQGEHMWINVSGKSRLYYRLEPGKTTELKLEGPGEIKLIVRGVSPAADTVSVPYSLVVSEDGKALQTFNGRAHPGPARWKGDKESASRSRSFKLRVGDGKHRLRIALQSKHPVAVRYSSTEGRKPRAQVRLQATAMRESAALLVNENATDYYVADASVPVQVDVIGPTQLRVTSRLIFPPAARGKVSYVLKVTRDGQHLADFNLTAEKSTVAECEAHKDWIIARGQTTRLDVPSGGHSLQFRLANKDAPGVALRFSIPKQEAPNGR